MNIGYIFIDQKLLDKAQNTFHKAINYFEKFRFSLLQTRKLKKL